MKPLTLQALSVECLYDSVALLLRLHSSEADASADPVVVAQDPGRDDLSVWGEERLQFRLRDARRQVCNV